MHIIGDDQFEFSQRLWRYFKTNWFLDFMRTGQIYFASTHEFEDQFEGSVAVIPPNFPTDPRYPETTPIDWAFEQLRELTKLNCWHCSDYESDAMWRLYADSQKGVAICTTPQRIQDAAKPFHLKPEYGHEKLYAGKVKYVDLLKERLRVNNTERFWHKHNAFSWEREFRIGISLAIASESVQVPDKGILVDFDVQTLVDCIYLGQYLLPNDIEVVRNAAKQHDLQDRVFTTSLLSRHTEIYIDQPPRLKIYSDKHVESISQPALTSPNHDCDYCEEPQQAPNHR